LQRIHLKGERRDLKTIKVFAIATCLLMVLMLTAPTFALKGPLVDNLQYKFYGDQTALFNALLAGDIDIMAWPLTYAQYQTAITTANLTVAPYSDLGDYEIAFNNNATDLSHTTDRKVMNYTEFRQAIACLIDKDGLISGPNVNGFGTRDDTQIARPTLNKWVNFNVSKYDANGAPTNNYPWDYNETHALELLWTNGWYSHVTYPTLASLLAASLPLSMGSVIYPPGHPRAGTAIDNIVAYIRSDDLPRKKAGESLVAEMTKIGIGTTVHEGSSSVCYTPVFISHDYDFYTAGWSFGANPLHFYSMNTPVGIYPGGPNLYMIDDAAMTFHATMDYPKATDTSGAQSIAEAKNCQYIQVQQAMLIPLYSSASYMAYRTGLVGAINFRGYGLTAALEYMFINAKVPSYSHPMTLKYGTLNPPVSINPIFSSWLWDYEVVDRIFNSPMATNPYKPTTPGKSPAGADQPWMAYDWKVEYMTNGNANVTFWFRHDITWQDGVPFTVDDLNYTIFIQTIYGDSWGHSDMAHVVGFQKWDDWTCSLNFDIPTFWALYTVTYDIIPQHIYKYIAIPADASSGSSLTGLHGEWPGKDSLVNETLSGAPFTWAQLTGPDGGKYMWIGTGMWQYSSGTYVSGVGGGLLCNPYPGFWMNITQGDIDFAYTWNPGPPPQGGSYGIGLSDLVLLANAYGTSGNGHVVPFKIGGQGVWEPGCDLAPPASVVGLSDLVTLALNYGKHWGNYPGGPSYIVASPIVNGTTVPTTNASITAQDNLGNPSPCDVEDPSGIGIHTVNR
jgi:ABC-type transport system substrate-binding protein